MRAMCVTVTQPLICVLFTLSVGVVCFFLCCNNVGDETWRFS